MKAATEVYCEGVIRLTQLHTGFQFQGKATLEQIEGFSMVEMGKTIKLLTPHLLWNLIGVLQTLL